MIIYYTGTGNSRYAAEAVKTVTGDDMVNAGEYIKAGRAGEFESKRPYVFCSPTYGWRIPRIFESFLRSASLKGERRAYFLMTCGSETGNACAKNAALCAELGLEYMGTAEIVMPENYAAMFPVPKESTAAKIRIAAEPGLIKAARAIEKGESLERVDVSLMDKIYTSAANPVFYSLCVKDKAFYATDKCVSCGKCAESCPMNDIKLVNGKPQWGGHCTHCMACLCGCPAEAIEYGKKSLGKPRYQCPHYEEGGV